jgi:hypothetical protein
LWALLAGGPIAMVLTVIVGILVNNSVTKAHIDRVEIKIDKVEADWGIYDPRSVRCCGGLYESAELERVRVCAGDG